MLRDPSEDDVWWSDHGDPELASAERLASCCFQVETKQPPLRRLVATFPLRRLRGMLIATLEAWPVVSVHRVRMESLCVVVRENVGELVDSARLSWAAKCGGDRRTRWARLFGRASRLD